MHVAAAVGVYLRPLWQIPRQTAFLCFLSWQLAVFGITIGYHRLFSHRSFSARRPLRVLLALLGCLGFQGSIKCEFSHSNIRLFPATECYLLHRVVCPASTSCRSTSAPKSKINSHVILKNIGFSGSIDIRMTLSMIHTAPQRVSITRIWAGYSANQTTRECIS